MMTVQPLSKKGENKNGVSARAYFEAVEYHRNALTGKDYAPTRWYGAGATELGLNGKVDFDDFEKAMDGFDPATGKPLTQNAGADNRRPGWDLTFSMEKSLAIVYEDPTTSPEEKEQILAIHRAAVEMSLEHLQTLVEVKTGKNGMDRRGNVGMVISMIDHFTTRAGDPDPHTHAVVHNVGFTTDPDGTVRWNGIDGAAFKENERGLGAFYRSAAQWGLKEHTDLKLDRVRELDAEGYETGEVYYRVAGVSDTQWKSRAPNVQRTDPSAPTVPRSAPPKTSVSVAPACSGSESVVARAVAPRFARHSSVSDEVVRRNARIESSSAGTGVNVPSPNAG